MFTARQSAPCLHRSHGTLQSRIDIGPLVYILLLMIPLWHAAVAAAGSAAPDADHHPLQGVRFAPLKASGCTGTRAEHVSEFVGISRKCVARKVLSALGRSLDVMEVGRAC